MTIDRIKSWLNHLPIDLELEPSIRLTDVKGSTHFYELTLESTTRPLIKMTFTFEIDMGKLQDLTSRLQSTPSPFPNDEEFRGLVEEMPDTMLGSIWEFTGNPTNYHELANVCVNHRGMAAGKKFGF